MRPKFGTIYGIQPCALVAVMSVLTADYIHQYVTCKVAIDAHCSSGYLRHLHVSLKRLEYQYDEHLLLTSGEAEELQVGS